MILRLRAPGPPHPGRARKRAARLCSSLAAPGRPYYSLGMKLTQVQTAVVFGGAVVLGVQVFLDRWRNRGRRK